MEIEREFGRHLPAEDRASLGLRRCPVCGRAPEAVRFMDEGVEMWRAECDCTLVVGTDEDDLRRRWDGDVEGRERP
jgi:hypothetical protein